MNWLRSYRPCRERPPQDRAKWPALPALKLTPQAKMLKQQNLKRPTRLHGVLVWQYRSTLMQGGEACVGRSPDGRGLPTNRKTSFSTKGGDS